MNTLRDKFLGLTNLQPIAVDIPEMDGCVYLRRLSASQMESLKDKLKANQNGYALLQQLLVDEHGNELVAIEDTDKLANLDGVVMTRIMQATQDCFKGDLSKKKYMN